MTTRRDVRTSSPAAAVEACHGLLLWLIPQLDKLPKSRRYSLGSRLEDCLLEVLEMLIAAAYRRDRTALLDQANRRLAVAQHLWRLAMELRAIAPRSYAHGSERMVDLGCQGGCKNFCV